MRLLFTLAFLLLEGCSLATLVLRHEAPPAIMPMPGSLVGLTVQSGQPPLDEHLFRHVAYTLSRAGVDVRPCSELECPPGTARLVTMRIEPFSNAFDCDIAVDRVLPEGGTRRIFSKSVRGPSPEHAAQACLDWATRARFERDALFLVAEEGLEPGIAAATHGRLEEAVTFFRAAAAKRPTAKVWLDTALCLEVLGRPDEAEEAFRQALAIEPNSMRVNGAYSEFHERLAQQDELTQVPPHLRLPPALP